MTKKVLFLSAAVLLLAAGCNKATSMQPNMPAASQSGAQPTPAGAQSQTSLKDLMMSGTAQKCMVNFSDSNNQSQGAIYIANGMMRGDFTSQYNGQTRTTHMINNGQNIYTWIDGMTSGFEMSAKMVMPTSTPMSASSTPQGMHRPGIDPNAQENYNCSAWTVDSTVFTPPTGVTFSNMMQMQGKGMMIHGMHGSASSSTGSSMGQPSSGY